MRNWQTIGSTKATDRAVFEVNVVHRGPVNGPLCRKGRPFADHRQSPSDSVETAIATELWRWAFLSPDVRGELTANGSGLCVTIEFYLCGEFQRIDFTRSHGIWCDGVTELSIRKLNRRAFLIAGAAFSPHHLAPFEIEFHFDRRRDQRPSRTIIRFGERDRDGSIRWHRNDKNAATMVANRPTENRNWAVAVELTPNET